MISGGLKFHENLNKNSKVTDACMQNLHNNVNENMFSFTFFMQIFMSFYDGQLKQHTVKTLYNVILYNRIFTILH